MWEIDDLSDEESEIENDRKPFLNPWNGLAPQELRVNTDAIVANAFESHWELKKRNPETEIGRYEFNTAKEFCKNADLKKDVFRKSKPGPEVMKF